MKKVFEETPFLYWSGNNNQIYKALVELHDAELVTGETVHKDGSPSKKVYTVTAKGLAELKQWVMSPPQAPELKKLFLVQFAWSDMLQASELRELLDNYEGEVQTQLMMHQNRSSRHLHAPSQSPRQRFIQEAISENIITACEHELSWIKRTREALLKLQSSGENHMDYQVKQKNNQTYMEVVSAAPLLGSEQDALDLVALFSGQDTALLMIHFAAFSEDFFNLKTRVAGNFIQKLVNYGVKTVALIPDEILQKGRFREMALELNRGSHFRMYADIEEAEGWLLKPTTV